MPKITAENITPKQLKGMRIATIVLAINSLLLLTLFIRSDMKHERENAKLDIENDYARAEIELLTAQVDSLTAELRRIEKSALTP